MVYLRLYFLRHGEAGARVEWQGADSERPLTTVGKARIVREAQTLAVLNLELDAIVTSPFVRAIQTAEIIAQQLNLTNHLNLDHRLAPGFNLEQLAELVTALPEMYGLLLVGHDPSLSDTITRLIGGGRLHLDKGGLAYVAVKHTTFLKGDLVWLLPADILVADHTARA